MCHFGGHLGKCVILAAILENVSFWWSFWQLSWKVHIRNYSYLNFYGVLVHVYHVENLVKKMTNYSVIDSLT